MSTNGWPSGAVIFVLPIVVLPSVLICSWSIVRALVPQRREERIELVEPLVPERLVAREPLGRLSQRLRLEVAQACRCAPAPRDEASGLEHLEVARDRGLRHPERGCEIAHGKVALCQAREDRS